MHVRTQKTSSRQTLNTFHGDDVCTVQQYAAQQPATEHNSTPYVVLNVHSGIGVISPTSTGLNHAVLSSYLYLRCSVLRRSFPAPGCWVKKELRMLFKREEMITHSSLFGMRQCSVYIYLGCCLLCSRVHIGLIDRSDTHGQKRGGTRERKHNTTILTEKRCILLAVFCFQVMYYCCILHPCNTQLICNTHFTTLSIKHTTPTSDPPFTRVFVSRACEFILAGKRLARLRRDSAHYNIHSFF